MEIIFWIKNFQDGEQLLAKTIPVLTTQHITFNKIYHMYIF